MKENCLMIGLILTTVLSSATGANVTAESVVEQNYVIPWSAIDEGGSTAEATSYRLVEAVGQSVTGRTQSTEYILQIGFLTTRRPTVNVEEERPGTIPSTYSLHQNYPNPFQSQTSIRYAISGNPLGNECQFLTSLKIYDLSGRLVRVLVHEYQQPGLYTAVWDGRDCCRFPVPAGTYFCRFDSGDYRATRKLLVLR